MRIGFHYHVPCYRDTLGQLWTDGPQGCFLDSLAQECDELICLLHQPRESELDKTDYPLTQTNIRLVELGTRGSLPSRALSAGKITQHLEEVRHEMDILLLRGPSPLLPAFGKRARHLPIALLLVSDLRKIPLGSRNLWSKIAVTTWIHWNYWRQRQLGKRALIIVNSHAIYEDMNSYAKRIFETRTTTIKTTDLFERDTFRYAPPYHLLFTGRIQKEKGIFEILDALRILVERGQDVVLDLVGNVHKGDTILDELMLIAKNNDLQDRVKYHGFKRLGPDLFKYYQQSDIYVIASKSDFEGFPRTIWEAMAHSLPVVATAVGSIHHYLRQGIDAMLVPPRDSQALAEAINTLLQNHDICRTLIANGLHLARQNTLEYRAKEMMSVMTSWVNDENGMNN